MVLARGGGSRYIILRFLPLPKLDGKHLKELPRLGRSSQRSFRHGASLWVSIIIVSIYNAYRSGLRIGQCRICTTHIHIHIIHHQKWHRLTIPLCHVSQMSLSMSIIQSIHSSLGIQFLAFVELKLIGYQHSHTAQVAFLHTVNRRIAHLGHACQPPVGL